MLEKVDLTRTLSKDDYKARLPLLRNRLYAAQKLTWDAKLPVIVVFEGWGGSGKGDSIQQLAAPIDPRGYKLYPITPPRTHEKERPWLWRFWTKLPARTEWAIFDGSWYRRVFTERVEKLLPEEMWRRGYRDIVDFERALADDGYLIIKFFLHISRAEQKKRFKKLTKDPVTAWHVSTEDWEQNRKYDKYILAAEELLERTESEWGPWTIVEATNKRYTRIKMLETVLEATTRALHLAGHLSPEEQAYLENYRSESDAPAYYSLGNPELADDDSDNGDGDDEENLLDEDDDLTEQDLQEA